MAKDQQKSAYKKFVTFLIGFFILILGITLILAWWEDVVTLIRGALGMMLAFGGLLALYTLNNNVLARILYECGYYCFCGNSFDRLCG